MCATCVGEVMRVTVALAVCGGRDHAWGCGQDDLQNGGRSPGAGVCRGERAASMCVMAVAAAMAMWGTETHGGVENGEGSQGAVGRARRGGRDHVRVGRRSHGG